MRSEAGRRGEGAGGGGGDLRNLKFGTFIGRFLSNGAARMAVKGLNVSTSLSLAGNSGQLTWVRHSSRKSSATHSYQCV